MNLPMRKHVNRDKLGLFLDSILVHKDKHENMSTKLKTRLKRVHNKIDHDNMELVNAINLIEWIATTYYVLASNSIRDYLKGNQRRDRLIVASIMRIVMAMCLLKYMIAFFSKNKLVMAMINDETKIVGNSRPISLMCTLCWVSLLIEGIYIFYLDMSKTFFDLEFMQLLRYQSARVKLNWANRIKYGRRMNKLVNYLYRIHFYAAVPWVSLTFIAALFLSYLKSNGEYYFVSLIFWIIVIMITLVHAFSMSIFIVSIVNLSAFYLINKFKELDQSFAYFVTLGDVQSLLRLINYHNYTAVLAHRINRFVRVTIFNSYYIATIVIQLMSYIAHEKSTTVYFRISIGTIVIFLVCLIFGVNLISANINRWSHRPINRLYSFVAMNKLNLKPQLKCQIFIERLSGPPIGYYCLNLFPMNNYEFYKYITFVAMNHILILSNFGNLWKL